MYLIIILAVLGTLHDTSKAETIEELEEQCITLERENAKIEIENKKLEQAAKSSKNRKRIAVGKNMEDNCESGPTNQTQPANVQMRSDPEGALALPNYMRSHRETFRTYKGRTMLVDCIVGLKAPANYSCVPYMRVTGIKPILIPGVPVFKVWCDSITAGPGWLVIQRRVDGSEKFYRTWAEYRDGFGKLEGDFFLGLEHIYKLTNYQRFELFVSVVSFSGKLDWARYDNFLIGSEEESYVLKSVGEFAGSEDVLSENVNSKFSTYDKESSPKNLSKRYHGGYWYIENSLQSSNPNGKYFTEPQHMSYGMHWASGESEKSIKMLIRPYLA